MKIETLGAVLKQANQGSSGIMKDKCNDIANLQLPQSKTRYRYYALNAWHLHLHTNVAKEQIYMHQDNCEERARKRLELRRS